MDIHIHLPHWLLWIAVGAGGIVAGFLICLGVVFLSMCAGVARGLGW